MELLIVRIGAFSILPVVHYSYEFTLAAAQAFQELNPSAVAVEYPRVYQDLLLEGLRRLPRVSVIGYGRDSERSYIRIEPVDPFIEAARLGLTAERPVECIDAALPFYPEIYEPLPDTYALTYIGHRRYCEDALRYLPAVRTEQDNFRERSMAYHLQELERKLTPQSDRPVLVLCGLSHLNGLAAQLNQPQAQPFEKPLPGRLYHLSYNSLGEVMASFPFFSAVYERRRVFSSVATDKGDKSQLDFSQPSGLQIVAGKKLPNVQEFSAREHTEVANNCSEDRLDILRNYVLSCRKYYEQETDDQIRPQQLLLIDQFARKYAAVKNMLLPEYYELLIAGRGCINSHFCYRMWEIGTHYPAQVAPSDIEVIELRADDISAFVRKVRMNPHAPLKPRNPLPRFLRRREKQRKPKKLDFHPFSICSYQPEDLTIENYGNYLRKKGKNILSEERKRVQPFETSLLDGIDLRETIRNWHTGKIYVQECSVIRGAADSLVVIFDEVSGKYPYTMTWTGEHHQESDMAFYATDPEQREVGPGIRKAIYGGFLMTMPPGRLFDVFADPAYRFAQNHGERLLLAAIDYGLEKFVIYASAKPPRAVLQVIAGRYGKRILHIPLSQLSPVMLQKIRTFHILADKSVRDYAEDYIH